MKTLLVYYSKTGVVDKMAQLIAKKMNGVDLYRIQTVRKYAEGMYEAWDQAQVEIADNKMPELSGKLPDLSKYDNVIIGGPVWGFNPSNPILSYVRQNDFSNNNIAAFWTYYDHDEKYTSALHREIPNFDPQNGLALSMSLMGNEKLLNQNIDKWIEKINF